MIKPKMVELNPLDDPKVMVQELDSARYSAELALIDRYHAFSSEILRLSLGGIAVFGFLFTFTGFDRLSSHEASSARPLVYGSLLLFGLAAILAVIYRYLVSETFRLHTEVAKVFLASPAESKWLERRVAERRRLIWACIISKSGAVLAMAAAAGVTALALAKILSAGAP